MPEPQTFYELMRCLEIKHPKAPQMGTANSPKQEPYRFAVFPSLSFSPSDLSHPEPSLLKKRADSKRQIYYLNHFGLLGPNGALPVHLTEYALYRIRHHDDHGWVEFLNLFHHRFFTLFYRAWVEGQPTAYQRDNKNAFFKRLTNLLGDSQLDVAPFQHQQRKHQEGIEKALAHSLGTSVKLKNFQGQWLFVSLENQTQLGRSRSCLGRTALLGDRQWDIQSKVHIEFGPMKWQEFKRFQPEHPDFNSLFQRVTNLLGLEYDWDYTCFIERGEIPHPLVNGRQQLGRNLWLGKRQTPSYPKVSRRGGFIQIKSRDL